MSTPNAADCVVVKFLQKGCVVKVTEFFDLGDFRVRGKVDGGWISMIDALDNYRYVKRRYSEQPRIVTSCSENVNLDEFLSCSPRYHMIQEKILFF